ncbi:hypothetical protein [Streptomyces sp. NPDC017868]|uniref:AMIN-like domain-containing (lipo)protein n=1 Tax=unclassified Streptomyces TaxID=2593676 RepID=UPI0037AA9DCD
MALTLPRLARTSAALATALLTGLLAAPTASAAPAAATSVTTTCTPTCVTATRYATYPDHDRLVFDFTADGLPQVKTWKNTDGRYSVGGSGQTEHLTTPGTSYLFFEFFGAHTFNDAGQPTYTSPTLQQPNLPVLKGIQALGDYEGYVDFGISLGPSSRYNVFTLTQPNRVVVDIYR